MNLKHWRMTALALAVVVVILLSFKPINAQSPILLNVTFQSLRQGTAGIVLLDGPNITGATASAFEVSYPCFSVSQGYACLVAVPMNEAIKDYPLKIAVIQEGGSEVQWNGKVKVVSGQFITEPDFTMPADKAALLQPDVEQKDEARLTTIYSLVTPETFWEGSFSLPTTVGKPTSPFGSTRLYRNDGKIRRHTGYDLSVPIGTPVLASADGRVVYAHPLAVHGNNIVIDHGRGVFSEYAHLSIMYVVPGQFVLQGDLIGLSGNTGRSTGPHIHWEIAVDGTPVDPVSFMQLKLPF